MERTNSSSGTEQGEVIATCAMCISGIVTTVIVALGVVLLVPPPAGAYLSGGIYRHQLCDASSVRQYGHLLLPD